MNKMVVLLALLLCSLAVSVCIASASDWYSYRFMFKDGYRLPMATECQKSERSLADVVAGLDSSGTDYRLSERVFRNKKPVVVDIQMGRVSSVGMDYTTGGTARSRVRVEYVYVERFAKGESLCNKTRDDDLSGKRYRQSLNRYR